MNGVHSRSILAGYSPKALASSSVTVVGLGALGQNIVQGLALCGIGRMILIDHDQFEPHNATRSPFFPDLRDNERFVGHKAPIVAHRALAVSTASAPEYLYYTGLVQELGDLPIMDSDVVVSAADSLSCRAWLAERCKLHGAPMVEGGFSGPNLNFSAFSGAADECCYRCHDDRRESFASCTRYALMAEEARIVPAIQTTAAVLGGLMAEQVVQLLHRRSVPLGERIYGDIRSASFRSVTVSRDMGCPCPHVRLPDIGTVRSEHPLATMYELGRALLASFGPGRIELHEPFMLTQACIGCKSMCYVGATESRWMIDSRCAECDGGWRKSELQSPSSVRSLSNPADLDRGGPIGSLPPGHFGMVPGSCVDYHRGDGGRGRAVIDGGVFDTVLDIALLPRPGGQHPQPDRQPSACPTWVTRTRA